LLRLEIQQLALCLLNLHHLQHRQRKQRLSWTLPVHLQPPLALLLTAFAHKLSFWNALQPAEHRFQLNDWQQRESTWSVILCSNPPYAGLVKNCRTATALAAQQLSITFTTDSTLVIPHGGAVCAAAADNHWALPPSLQLTVRPALKAV
jgi:hypothetical protein